MSSNLRFQVRRSLASDMVIVTLQVKGRFFWTEFDRKAAFHNEQEIKQAKETLLADYEIVQAKNALLGTFEV